MFSRGCAFSYSQRKVSRAPHSWALSAALDLRSLSESVMHIAQLVMSFCFEMINVLPKCTCFEINTDRLIASSCAVRRIALQVAKNCSEKDTDP